MATSGSPSTGAVRLVSEALSAITDTSSLTGALSAIIGASLLSGALSMAGADSSMRDWAAGASSSMNDSAAGAAIIIGSAGVSGVNKFCTKKTAATILATVPSAGASTPPGGRLSHQRHPRARVNVASSIRSERGGFTGGSCYSWSRTSSKSR